MRSVSYLLFLIAWLSSSAYAAGTVGTGTPDSCDEPALRSTLIGGGLVKFDCGMGHHTIVLTEELVISDDTMIDGNGRISISGGSALWESFPTVEEFLKLATTRVIRIDQDAVVELHNIVIRDGIAGFVLIEDEWADGFGGGIRNEGDLKIVNSRVTGNFAYGFGAGIYNRGNLTVVGSLISENLGTGIANHGGHVEILQSTIKGSTRLNRLPAFLTRDVEAGGGIHTSNDKSGRDPNPASPDGIGSLRVLDTTVSGFRAKRGAGIFVEGHDAEIVNSTFAENTASAEGSSIYFQCIDFEYASRCTINRDGARPKWILTHVTSFGNRIDETEATVTSIPLDLDLKSYGIVFEGIGDIELNSNILSMNSLHEDGCAIRRGYGTRPNLHFVSNGKNLFAQHGYAPIPCPIDDRDLRNVNPRFVARGLADNGGPTETIALRDDSPAIDTGGLDCPSIDQRGQPRPQDGDPTTPIGCDIGAFEVQRRPASPQDPSHACWRTDDLGSLLRSPEIRCRWWLLTETDRLAAVIERVVTPYPIASGGKFEVTWRVDVKAPLGYLDIVEPLPGGYKHLSSESGDLVISGKDLATGKLLEKVFLVQAPDNIGADTSYVAIHAITAASEGADAMDHKLALNPAFETHKNKVSR